MITKRAVLVKPGQFEISETKVNPQSDQLLVKIAACGLCNWELNHWKGLLGEFPQTLGHEWSGTVVEIGSDVRDFKPGDVVTALPDSMTGFSEYAVENQKNCFKLSNKVNPIHALGEPLKCIVTVLRAAAPEAGDCGVVLGCGAMGLWCIQAMAGRYLSSIIAIDIDDEKLKLAVKFGATHAINSQKENVKERIAEITKGNMADFVIEGTGIPRLLNTAMFYLRTSGRGRLILMSSHESISKEFDFREAISRSIEIRVSHPRYSLNQLDDMRRAVAYLNNGTFQMEDIITHQFKLDDIQIAFETLENKPLNYIKGIVMP